MDKTRHRAFIHSPHFVIPSRYFCTLPACCVRAGVRSDPCLHTNRAHATVPHFPELLLERILLHPNYPSYLRRAPCWVTHINVPPTTTAPSHAPTDR